MRTWNTGLICIVYTYCVLHYKKRRGKQLKAFFCFVPHYDLQSVLKDSKKGVSVYWINNPDGAIWSRYQRAVLMG